jgi:tRNA pseudouridine55 synthase
MAVVVYTKRYTETLKLMLERFRLDYPQYQDSKITYAGRLDPLAEGVILLLTDNDVHRKEEFLGLDKEYEVKCLFGVSTDTYDVLGTLQESTNVKADTLESIQRELESIKELSSYPYPPYSSKTVGGKPLYQYAREGSVGDIEVPDQKLNIHEMSLIDVKEQGSEELKASILATIQQIEGDFRQQEIEEDWKHYFAHNTSEKHYIASIRCTLGSGSYVRSIVHELGKRLNSGACSLKITRISVGDYTKEGIIST